MRQFSIFVPMDFNENFAGIVSFVEFKSEILADVNIFNTLDLFVMLSKSKTLEHISFEYL